MTDTRTRLGLGAFVLMMVAAAFALVTLSPAAHAGTEGVATTGGTVVTGSGPRLLINCKWELPDMTVGDVTTFGHGAPYDDDLGTVTPQNIIIDDAPPIPCDGDPEHFGGEYDIQSGYVDMMTVTPNADDLPEERKIQLWAAIESTGGHVDDIAEVIWDVYEPNENRVGGNFGPGFPGARDDETPHPNYTACAPATGFPDTAAAFSADDYCLKLQHHLTQETVRYVPCNNIPQGMLNQAVQTSQMTQGEADEIIARSCGDSGKFLFESDMTVSKEQTCGTYIVNVTVYNNEGEQWNIWNAYDVVCFQHLATDFDAIDWGELEPTGHKVLHGDWTFPSLSNDPIAGTQGMTVRNQGNDPMVLHLKFSDLVLASNPTKVIDQFDASLKSESLPLTDPPQGFDPIDAGETVWFCEQPLGHNQDAKLNLSVLTNAAIPGDYSGSLHLWSGSWNNDCQRES